MLHNYTFVAHENEKICCRIYFFFCMQFSHIIDFAGQIYDADNDQMQFSMICETILPARLQNDTETNQIGRTVWSHQPISSLFLLSGRETGAGTECSFSTLTLPCPLTPAKGVMGGGPILEFDNVKPLTGKKCKIRDRMEIICS